MPLLQDIVEVLSEFMQLSELANEIIEESPENDYIYDVLRKLDAQESKIRQQLYIMDSVLKKLESGTLSDKEYTKQERIFFATRAKAQKEIDVYADMVHGI